MQTSTVFVLVAVSLISFSCVSARKFQDTEAEKTRVIQENAYLNLELEKANESISSLSRVNEGIRQDTARLGKRQRELTSELIQLSRTNKQLQEQVDRMATGHAAEIQQALIRLRSAQDDLQVREDQVRQQETQVNRLMAEVTAKGARVNELENILRRQEEAVQQLRQTVANALLGFDGRGLTVQIRQGKVYVSLEESLLFASGSATVDRAGQTALVELAKVLEQNPDITIMIEGHTDDVPLRPGEPIRDNWDLSVLRATSIIRILQRSGNINPQRFIAAGRGEFSPIDPARTAEARRKNRRTEIILTPNLDPLFRIIEMR
ncbi:MAG TPA: flagellar motor protein MotB [Bacteroidales bacterium]|nr:flagellar motor protein MotB [Bacteroidales bacterium]